MDKIRRKLRLGALRDATITAMNAEFLKFTTRGLLRPTFHIANTIIRGHLLMTSLVTHSAMRIQYKKNHLRRLTIC